MSEYHTEGYIKKVTVASMSDGGMEVSFSIEAAVPYLFESKENGNGVKIRRKTLLMSKCGDDACVVTDDHTFKLSNVDFTALLVVKANHMNVRLFVELEDGKPICDPCDVKKIEIK